MPGPEEVSRPVASFRAHSNYIRAFATVTGFNVFTSSEQVLTSLKTKFHNERPFKPSDKPLNRKLLRRSLANAWGTEVLLGLSSLYDLEDELVRLTNNWGVVQLYYSTYHAVQALAITLGFPRPETHSKTQKLFMSLWTGRKSLLQPWSLGVAHDTYLNVPSDVDIDEHVHPWSTCDSETCWSLSMLALRSTRKDAVGEALASQREELRRQRARTWREEEEARVAHGKRPRKMPRVSLPRLDADARRDVSARVRPFTFLDYLYRLRVKANYIDPTMFTDGPENEAVSTLVHRDLRRVASSTLFLHELAIASIVGSQLLSEIADEWLHKNTAPESEIGLSARIHLFDA